MGKFIYVDDNGREIPIREVESLSGRGTIVALCGVVLRPTDSEKMEELLAKKFGRDVVVLDAKVSKILALEG